ncbi:DUF6042 family protein [Brevibacillus fulvus]|uniref:Uncharacterized protein n=1 Tax=Brevibacillus fulvus TaxID=1125967 RepID=A0A939BS74_9BACL|nr:DUF6042 family protein [Brevibacillus fulvus]MBM7590178.1 hypothetical protein [Brevibacillus fulvus]
MQTIREVRKNREDVVIPSGYKANGWASVLSHEMNVLFHSICYAVTKFDTQDEMNKALDEIKGLEGTFTVPTLDMFKSEQQYNNYVNLLEKHKKFLQRSNFSYPESREAAIELFKKWGIVLDKDGAWDVPVDPFPEVQEIFVLTEAEQIALNHIKLEALVHPVFSKLILMLHEKDDNSFALSKNELKEMLNTNDAMLREVLIKLTPYMTEAIDNIFDIPDDEKLEFTIVWERIYEDFLGDRYAETLQ